jgi:hypothetical protein
MDFKQLQALGGFISPALVRKEIEFTYRPTKPAETWADPETPEFEPVLVTERATVFVRKRTSRDFLDIMQAGSDADRAFLALFRCLCNEDGTPFFPSVEDAASLAEWMFLPLIGAVNEVNSFDPKGFPPRTTSGSTLPSPSAGEASLSGKSRFRKKSARKS